MIESLAEKPDLVGMIAGTIVERVRLFQGKIEWK
jgi:hypothetical protein